MTTKIIPIPERKTSYSKEPSKPNKPFEKEKKKTDTTGISPLLVFQNTLSETASPVEVDTSIRPIDELFLKLCDRVEHSVSNGIEETTLLLSDGQGEVTLKKYDTAPQQFVITISATDTSWVIPHIPELSDRLTDHFKDLEFSITAQHAALRKEEKRYKTKHLGTT